MVTRVSIEEQLRGSLEVFIATFAVITGLILMVEIIAGTIGTNTVDLINENYGPHGMFNLGLPDIFWILLILFILSFAVKFSISLLMPIILPFYGYCPKCGVKPLAEESRCTECGCNLYRKRISKFDIKMYLVVTLGFAVFIIIWYVLAQIVGIRTGVDPGI